MLHSFFFCVSSLPLPLLSFLGAVFDMSLHTANTHCFGAAGPLVSRAMLHTTRLSTKTNHSKEEDGHRCFFLFCQSLSIYSPRYLEDGELENHDRMTTAGLAVACLRAGDETSALEMLESAVKPYSSSTPEGNEELQVEEEEEQEEEDWEALEAEEEQEKILEAEGEVLPELLDFYLERGQKESSQEAAAGVSFGHHM